MGQVIETLDGVQLVAERVGALVEAKGATCVVVDGYGPAKNLVPAIEEAVGGRCPVWVMSAGDVADACSSIYDAVVTEQFRHTGQQELDDSMRNTVKRMLPGGRIAWDRKAAAADITGWCAVTWAFRGLEQYPGDAGILF